MKRFMHKLPEFGMIAGASFLYMVGMLTLVTAGVAALIALASVVLKVVRE